MGKRKKQPSRLQKKVIAKASKAQRNVLAAALAGPMGWRQPSRFGGGLGAVILVCALGYLGLAWLQPDMALPEVAGVGAAGFGLGLVTAWWLGRRSKGLRRPVLVFQAVALIAGLAAYTWLMLAACWKVSAAGPLPADATRLIHLPGMLGLGLAYAVRLIMQFGVGPADETFSNHWPARIALGLGLVGDVVLTIFILDAFYL